MGTATDVPQHIEAMEDRYTAYLRQHYGPAWEHDNEEQAYRLRVELAAAYDAAGIPDFDRIDL